MKCPRCVQKVAPASPSCPHCGYSLAAACALYGSEAVVAERLMDVEGALEAEKAAAVQAALEAFGRLFPQLFLLLYLGPLPPPASPRQFAFWLLNHAAVPDLEVTRPNECGLLLVVDPHAGSAVLTAGYFLENFVDQEELDGVLKSASRDLGRADYAGAVKAVTAALGVLLKGKVREAARHPERFQAAPLPEAGRANFPPLVRTGEAGAVADFPPEVPGSEEWWESAPVPEISGIVEVPGNVGRDVDLEVETEKALEMETEMEVGRPAARLAETGSAGLPLTSGRGEILRPSAPASVEDMPPSPASKKGPARRRSAAKRQPPRPK